MPWYEFSCPGGHRSLHAYSFHAVPSVGCEGPNCLLCDKPTKRILSQANFVGWERASRGRFKDASEAAGYEIHSTKEIDRLERAGVMRPIGKKPRPKRRNLDRAVEKAIDAVIG